MLEMIYGPYVMYIHMQCFLFYSVRLRPVSEHRRRFLVESGFTVYDSNSVGVILGGLDRLRCIMLPFEARDFDTCRNPKP